jgi:hypothetical protein
MKTRMFISIFVVVVAVVTSIYFTGSINTLSAEVAGCGILSDPGTIDLTKQESKEYTFEWDLTGCSTNPKYIEFSLNGFSTILHRSSDVSSTNEYEVDLEAIGVPDGVNLDVRTLDASEVQMDAIQVFVDLEE